MTNFLVRTIFLSYSNSLSPFFSFPVCPSYFQSHFYIHVTLHLFKLIFLFHFSFLLYFFVVFSIHACLVLALCFSSYLCVSFLPPLSHTNTHIHTHTHTHTFPPSFVSQPCLGATTGKRFAARLRFTALSFTIVQISVQAGFSGQKKFAEFLK